MAPWATVDDDDSAFALGVEIIGKGIRAGRLAAGLTQQRLGWHVGVSQAAISRLETGTLTGLRFRTLARIVGELESHRSDYAFPSGPAPKRWEVRQPSGDDEFLDVEDDADGYA